MKLITSYVTSLLRAIIREQVISVIKRAEYFVNSLVGVEPGQNLKDQVGMIPFQDCGHAAEHVRLCCFRVYLYKVDSLNPPLLNEIVQPDHLRRYSRAYAIIDTAWLFKENF
ncbi:MAG TPA: hypothetical protein VE715_16730 [Blastocatellia bacterium]|nr:hypothetical protein [Blastocatellia bacterium]